MQAALFYQVQGGEDAVPIQLVNLRDWENMQTELSAFHQQLRQWQNFSANVGECLLLLSPGGQLERVLVGTEDGRTFNALAMAANKLAPGRYHLTQTVPVAELLAWGMAQYKFLRYKTAEIPLKTLLVSQADYQALEPRVDAIFRVRDLINTPCEDMGPKQFSDAMEGLAQLYHADFSTVVGEDLCNKNFPGIYTVGRAGAQAPRLVMMEWGQEKHPLVVLVGKGVCFDSGGLNLKPASAMRLMKKDMGGAAQVLGLAQLIMHFNLPIRLLVLCPCVENTIDADAYRPGDVIRMRNGLHVEIDNTDAEGRVIMADALSYACEQNPSLVIDISTLTGAARVAVGTEISALFSNSKTLAWKLMEEGENQLDPIWPLPLYAGYKTMNDSLVADLCNSTASSYAGAITAALFLQNFIDPNVVWAHLDLMAYNVSSKPGHPEGGEAMSILALFSYLQKNYEN